MEKIIYRDDKYGIVITKIGGLFRLSKNGYTVRESFDVTEIKNKANELINKENEK